ncbi:MAG TPA: carbohydrate ABC transporter permease [Polyangiaceae bacterium]|jgi:raffinose/stachyose/melibiose transport system permease protein|nr:carbohydrate ABC transporter permease [Polyangiaceae bacterium]
MLLQRYTLRTLARELVLVLVAAIWLIPFYFLIVVSLKPSTELFSDPLALPKHATLGNYPQAWRGTGVVTLGAALKNSVIITVGSVVCLIAVGSSCAYAIARRLDRFGTALYLFFVMGIILPFQLGIVPAYVAVRKLGLAGTYPGMILLYTSLLMPLTVFLYTGFFRTLPSDYEEAAYVDGASRRRTFARIIFPLLRPVTATVAVLAAMIIWNDFFVQLIFLSGSKRQTLPVAIYSFVGEFAAQWPVIFAAVIVTIAPLLGFYLFAQRTLVRGFTGGIKS